MSQYLDQESIQSLDGMPVLDNQPQELNLQNIFSADWAVRWLILMIL